jgi:hypothetical protein
LPTALEKKMNLTVNTAVPSPMQYAGLAPRSTALNQVEAATDAPTSSITISPTDPQAANARVAKYLHAMDTNFHTGQDAKDVANALAASMQTLIRQRPELASAQFDFQLDNGSVKVTSSGLSNDDKTWLQNLLNGNNALVQAANAFHRDAVGGYSSWAEADGTPLTQTQSDALAKHVDETTNFMALFNQVSTQGAQFVSSGGGTLYGSNGAKIDFSRDVETAIGFLSFMQGANSLVNGTGKYVESNGRVSFGAERADLFNQSMMKDFYPSEKTSIGMYATA